MRDWRDAHFSQQPIAPKRIALREPDSHTGLWFGLAVGVLIFGAAGFAAWHFGLVTIGKPVEAVAVAPVDPDLQPFAVEVAAEPKPEAIPEMPAAEAEVAAPAADARLAVTGPSEGARRALIAEDEERLRMLDRMTVTLTKEKAQCEATVAAVDAMVRAANSNKTEEYLRSVVARWESNPPKNSKDSARQQKARANLETFLAAKSTQLDRRTAAVIRLDQLSRRQGEVDMAIAGIKTEAARLSQ